MKHGKTSFDQAMSTKGSFTFFCAGDYCHFGCNIGSWFGGGICCACTERTMDRRRI